MKKSIPVRFPSRPLLTLIASVALIGCAMAPPVQEMSDARQAIKAAADADADHYAPIHLHDAERLMDSATHDLDAGAYDTARQAAIAAREKAIQARDKALSAQQNSPSSPN